MVDFIELSTNDPVSINPANVTRTRDNPDEADSTIIEHVGGGQTVVKGKRADVNKKLKP